MPALPAQSRTVWPSLWNWSAVSSRRPAGGVVTTSDPDLPVHDVLDRVLHHGVRLQGFTGA
jgi:hypothetical protein